MRKVFEILTQIAPELEVEGEMHADAALDENISETLAYQLALQRFCESIDDAKLGCSQHFI